MLYRHSARELNQRFLKGELSAVAIVSHFLSRIKSYDGEIGAFLQVYQDRALEKAKAIDIKFKEKKPLGKLAGVPIALKDNMHVKGELTTCASKFLINYRAVFDSTVAQLLENEDAIILGKTNLDEFAMGSTNENSALKVTKNPWDLNCVPGGSSGGSAAAVGARLCPIALGSDTGGSVRLPAAFCGVFGYKPTYGRVSRYGLVAFGSSLDQIGPMAAYPEDIALVMEVLGRHDPKDATSFRAHPDDYFAQIESSIAGKKIGVPWAFLDDLPETMRSPFEAALKVLEDLGCEIVEVDLNLLKYSIATYYIIASAEASTNLARFDGIRYGVRSKRAETLEQLYEYSKGEGFGPEVKKRILMGTYVLSSGYKDDYYKRASKVRVKMANAFEKALELVDVIAMPSSTGSTFAFGAIRNPLDIYLQDIFTIGANLAGLPAISAPCGFTKDDLPVGLQFIGARRDDCLVNRISYAYSQATEYYQAIPPAYDRGESHG